MKNLLKVICIILICAIFCTNFVCTAAQKGLNDKSSSMLLNESFSLIEGENKEITFTIANDDKYLLAVEYNINSSFSEEPEIVISIGDKYKDLSFVLSRSYEYEYTDGGFRQDKSGNDMMPDQKESKELRRVLLNPTDNNFFEFKKGNFKLDIKCVSGSLSVNTLELVRFEGKSYSEYSKDLKKQNNEYSFKQEAEILWRKSDLNIAVTYDRSSPNISPNSPYAIKYNMISSNSFSNDGQWISWSFDVPQDGWYYFDLYYRQEIVEGMPVHRRVLINGEVLFDELEDVTFEPSRTIKCKTLGENGNDFAVFLNKGNCIFTLEVTLKPLQDSIDELAEIINELNRLSSKIEVIVGKSADLYRDYDFDVNIPDFVETLQTYSEKLTDISKVDILGKENSARIKEFVRVLDKMADRPKRASKQLSYFQSGILSLSDILGSLESQPLGLDYIVLRSADSAKTYNEKQNIWGVLLFRLKSFFSSFVADYNTVETGANSDWQSLNVWVGANDASLAGFSTGREHYQIINELIIDSYSSTRNVNVKMSLVDAAATLTQAVASGKGPDVVLFTPKGLISNMYYRDALIPLNNMDNFDSIRKRVTKASLIAVESQGKTYAIPEIQAYQMMFYRTDILAEMGLSVPKTWEEFNQITKQLQIERMESGIPSTTRSFEMLLLQNNAELYNESQNATLLTDQKAVASFIKWVDFYETYNVPFDYSGLNRFRSGKMPIIIESINFYTQLAVAAPEIKGLWQMAPVPATDNNGTLSNAVSSMTTGAVVVKHTKKTDYKLEFDFIDWWTSDEIQSEFATSSEIRIGVSGRYYPANIKALGNVLWTKDERTAVEAQRNSAWDIPQTPATYMVERNIAFALRKTIVGNEFPRDVLSYYANEINSELTKKRQELGLED